MSQYKKLEEKYINLVDNILRSKDDTINELLRINRDMIQETRNLIYEFRKFVEKSDNKENKKGSDNDEC